MLNTVNKLVDRLQFNVESEQWIDVVEPEVIHDIVIHAIYKKDGGLRLAYEVKGEWKPRTCWTSFPKHTVNVETV